MIRKLFSSTAGIPETATVPRHVAVIMDGNGRWAKKRLLPRVAGHQQGVERVRDVIQACIEQGVEYLTLFAFSSENWRRPKEEVSKLMELFVMALEREVDKMHKNGIRLRVVGDLAQFSPQLQELIRAGEVKTAGNERLVLTIAANYGGRWDILNAMNRWLAANPDATTVDEAALAEHLSMAHAPEPDLFIRTGGEQRISNFLIWQLAYTELYFTDTLWPDFGAESLAQAIVWYQKRERRFGRTSEQLVEH
ncbi:MAG: di-trans,poly-cis-decaprenylcistransferase [Betaproteobacteria bacterium]|nr:di-trans,poly-cis-decaprenylcistransferase [Betaproteobacteria bacterium]